MAEALDGQQQNGEDVERVDRTHVGQIVVLRLLPGRLGSPEAESLAIGGGMISTVARRFLAWAEQNPTDAFPSGHTAVALLCLFRARRVSAGLSILYVPIVIGIIFSTVYLHYHYVVDVLGGAALACAGG